MDSYHAPFRKGIPVYYAGDLANRPEYGCGIVEMKYEIIVPLIEFDDAKRVVLPRGECTFWPMLTRVGVRWLYLHAAYGEKPDDFYRFEIRLRHKFAAIRSNE